MSSEPKPEVVSSAAHHADTDDDECDVKTSSRSAMMNTKLIRLDIYDTKRDLLRYYSTVSYRKIKVSIIAR